MENASSQKETLMKPGIVTWNPVLKLLLNSGVAPLTLMEVFWGLGQARAVMTATRLGIFEALSDGPADAEHIAEVAACDPHATTVLLNALVGFDYLKRKAGQYSLTSKSSGWLLSDSSGSLVEMMSFLDDLFQGVEPMAETIRSGDVSNFHHQPRTSEGWRNYVRGLGHLAAKIGGPVAKRVPIDQPPQRLLDVGGGHGMFSVAFCRRHPTVKAEVFDLPGVVEHGREMVEEAGFSDRVTYRPGDLRNDEWGEGYDVIFLFNVMHNLAPEECAEAAKKAFRALRPGGTFVVLDSQHSGGDGNLSAVAGFNELFFFLISGSQAWPESQVRQWLEDAGFETPKRGTVVPLPGLLMLTTRRPLAPKN